MSTRRRKAGAKNTEGTSAKVSRRALVTDPETSARLARIRQRHTTPEMAVRRILSALGHRFRVHNRDLPGSPDIANRKRRWAVFVHGCYWHSHQGCVRATVPKRNREFWEEKFAANRERDARALAALEKMGYRTLVVWECETESPDKLADLLTRSRIFDS